MMALRRLNEKLERLPFKEIRFDESSNIIIREGLIEITVEKNKNTLEKIPRNATEFSHLAALMKI